MSRLCLYFRRPPESDRWIPGDRYVRPIVRRIVRGRPRPGGLEKVCINLRLGLERAGVPYVFNLPFDRLRPSDHVAVLGVGPYSLEGYDRPNPVLAGIGLMTHPSEWPSLCEDHPVVRYLQHSAWCDAVYRPWFGERCAIWPVGIDTERWRPVPPEGKTTDFLVYDKIHWDRPARETDLLAPILDQLRRRGLSFQVLRYGGYQPSDYLAALARSRALLFLSAHESQGIAAQEAMSAGLPILAWDPGFVQDPTRHSWGQPRIPATSVPWFDERCGRRFRDASEFPDALEAFLDDLRARRFAPRDYVLENLRLEDRALHFQRLAAEAHSSAKP